MKCKYCQAELEEGMTLCSICGKEQEEETPAVEAEAIPAAEIEETPAVAEEAAAAEIKEGIKATPGKITLAIVAGVVVLALLVAMVLSGIDGDLFAKQLHTLGPFQQGAAQCALTLKAHEHHGTLRAPQIVLQVVADAARIAHTGGRNNDLGRVVQI